MTDQRPPAGLRSAAVDAVAAAALDDTDALWNALDAIERYGVSGTFGALLMWAEVVHRSLRRRDDEGGGTADFFGFRLVDKSGETVDDPDADPEMRPIVWATRFVVAVSNRDEDQAVALFRQALHEPVTLGVDAVLTLLSQAADVARDRWRSRATDPSGERS